eukprot:4100347-Prymnesium_polylepis.1
MALRGLPFRAAREVSCEREAALPAGQYVLVPFTHTSGVEGRYQLSVWASEPPAVEELQSVDEAVARALEAAARPPPPDGAGRAAGHVA